MSERMYDKRRPDGPVQERQRFEALAETTAQSMAAMMDGVGQVRDEAQAALDTAQAALDTERQVAEVKAQHRDAQIKLMQNMGVYDTMGDLETLPSHIGVLEHELLKAQQAASEHKRNEIAKWQDNLQVVITDASLAAFAESVDGKNKETRDVQLAAFLNKDTPVAVARGHLRDAENKQAELDAAVTAAELAVKGAVNRFKAACYTAELQTALIRLMAG